MLCSGGYKLDGFTTLDCNPKCEPDIVGRLPEFKLGSLGTQWDEIYLIHGIEHFTARDGCLLLADIHSALAPGGTAILEQPNLESIAKAILGMETYTDEWERSTLWALYGEPSDDPGMAHKWSYTPSLLCSLLEQCGFSADKIKVGAPRSHIAGRDFRVEATK